MTAAPEVFIPTSEQEAIEAFGDGSNMTVVAGATILMPEISHGRLTPKKALLLNRAGLAGVNRSGTTVTMGATTPVSELVDLPSPLGPAAANVADIEIRAQGTVGGNVCAIPGVDAPRGDLQGPLLALGATVRSTGAGGERAEPLEEFLTSTESRLVLEVAFEEPSAGGYARVDRPHAHTYTALAVSAARAADGAIRIAVTGAGPRGVRLTSAEAQADDPRAAGQAALADVKFSDDALASAWYRERTLPVLVGRALTQLREAG
jgi:aerobic carbon-monoxide dehydrogenase medium subunit